MRDWKELHFLSSLLLASTLGLILGAVVVFAYEAASNPPAIVHESGSDIASVVLEGFRDGALRGKAAGDIRLFVQDESVPIKEDGTFAIVHPSLRVEVVTVPVPPGMQFVASVRGKKYYPVTSSDGERITVENRIYFKDSASAQAAGYVR